MLTQLMNKEYVKCMADDLETATEFACRRSKEGQTAIGRLIQDCAAADIPPDIALSKVIWTCGTILATGIANMTNSRSDWRSVLTDDNVLREVEKEFTQAFRRMLAGIASGENTPVGRIEADKSITAVSLKSGNA
ncbi:MAG: hypothetical protein FJ247_13190 [Nitrospira sp.]|nr:hypothetical protein [Nitrospira sp.]